MRGSNESDTTIVAHNFTQDFIYDFHPVWFASVMGSGVSACLLYKFPYPLKWLEILGIIMFSITCFLFLLFNLLFILKVIFIKDWRFLTDVKQNVFLGCYAMGFCTIINMITFLTSNNYGWFIFTYTLFWIDLVIAVLVAWGVTFTIFWKSAIADFDKHGMNATLLLPLVTMTVTSSTGSLLVDKIPEHMKLFHIILCFMLWANTIALSFPFIGIYFAKLYITKLPSKAMIFTCFIPIGVMGQGAFGIILFGHNSLTFVKQNTDILSSIFNDSQNIELFTIPIQLISILLALFLLSFGYFMTFLAIASLISTGLQDKFSKNWWAMTFPLGTMALGNSKLGELYHLKFFHVMGTIYAVATILITLACLIGSIFVELPHFWLYSKQDNHTFSTQSKQDLQIDVNSDLDLSIV